MILSKWDLNRLTENEDGTYTPALLNRCNCQYIGTTQGRKFYQGNLYISVANTGTPHNGRIVTVDSGTGDIKADIPLSSVTTSELEGLCYRIVGDNLYWYLTDYYNIFKLTF